MNANTRITLTIVYLAAALAMAGHGYRTGDSGLVLASLFVAAIFVFVLVAQYEGKHNEIEQAMRRHPAGSAFRNLDAANSNDPIAHHPRNCRCVGHR